MRVAVVTGGARRIGATIVSSLLEDGWAVIVHCNRSLTQAKQLITRGKGAIRKWRPSQTTRICSKLSRKSMTMNLSRKQRN